MYFLQYANKSAYNCIVYHAGEARNQLQLLAGWDRDPVKNAVQKPGKRPLSRNAEGEFQTIWHLERSSFLNLRRCDWTTTVAVDHMAVAKNSDS